MKTLDEARLFQVLDQHAQPSPWLRKKALAYLFRYNGSDAVEYKQEREKEIVQGSVQKNQLVVVQPGGEFHFVKDGKHDIAAPVATTESDAVQSANLRGGASYTAQSDVDAALETLIKNGANAEDFELIGWCDSTNRVRAYIMPNGFGDFQVDKMATWKEMQPGNENHAVVASETDAYCNLTDNLRDDWYLEDDESVTGNALIARLTQLTSEDIQSAIS
jgi:hypothetical protein